MDILIYLFIYVFIYLMTLS